MALDNTKTITSATYNGNNWPVGGESGGYLSNMILSKLSQDLFLKDIFVDNCRFETGQFGFTKNSSNVTFKNCVFDNARVICTQEIHDAIVNGENNDYSNATFNIIS